MQNNKGLYKNKFYDIMDTIADLFILNVLFIVFCLPGVTIGAALSSMIDTTRRMERGEAPAVIRTFWGLFRSNFVSNTKLWGVLLLIGAILGFDIWFGANTDLSIGILLLMLCGIFCVPYMCVLIYCFPVRQAFHSSIKETLKKSVLIAVLHLPQTLLLGVLYFAPLGFILIRPVLLAYLLPIIITFGFSGIHYAAARFLSRIISKYEPQEDMPPQKNI